MKSTMLLLGAGSGLIAIGLRQYIRWRNRADEAETGPGYGYRRGQVTAYDHERFEPWRYEDSSPPTPPVETREEVAAAS